MRPMTTPRTLLALGLAAGTATLWSGCAAKKQTELVPGVSTQVRVPKELKSIRIDAAVSGANVFCGVYDVVNGVARLPRTLALQSTGRGSQVTVYVTGYRQATTDPDATQDQQACVITPIPVVKDAKHTDGTSRVLRAARTNYRADHVLFLPMPLKFSCFDQNCPIDQNLTCKAGQCVPMDVDEKTLPDYSDSLVFGNSSTCFSPKLCLPDAVVPQVVDEETCTYALWKTPGAPTPPPDVPFVTNGSGVNVRAFFDDGSVSEVLDLDPVEGFSIDASGPQIFKLSPGLCALTKPTAAGATPPAHRIAGLVASGLCAPKTVYQPLCDEESPSNPDADGGVPGGGTNNADGGAACQLVPLAPSPNVLAVLMDDTTDMDDLTSTNAANKAAYYALGLALGDPVFEATKLLFAFTPGKTTCGGFAPEKDGAALVKESQAEVAAKIKAAASNPVPGPTALSVALKGTYAKLSSSSYSASYDRKAVIILGAGPFADDCGGGASLPQLAGDARSASGIRTYVVQFRSSGATGPVTPNPNAFAVGQNGGYYTEDQGPAAISDITDFLATCTYDVPTGVAANGSVSYDNQNPVGPATVPISPGCKDGRGWQLELAPDGVTRRVHVCDKDCADLRTAQSNAAKFQLAQGKKPQPFPVYAQACPGATVPLVDGGAPVRDAGPDARPLDSGTDAADAGAADAGTD